MIIYNKQSNLVEITNTIINTALNGTGYTTIQMKHKAVGGIETTKNLISASGMVTTSNLVTFDSTVFGLANNTLKLADGIYEIKFQTLKNGIIEEEKLCLFVDNNIPCSLTTDEQKLAYLSLKASQDCSCDCDKLNLILNTLIINDNKNCNC